MVKINDKELCTNFETILRNFNFGHVCHFVCHLDHFVPIFPKPSFPLRIRTLQIGSAPVLGKFHAVSIIGHLCHYVCRFLCHSEHFGNNILEILIYISYQNASIGLFSNYEIISHSINFGSCVPSFVPHFVPYGAL